MKTCLAMATAAVLIAGCSVPGYVSAPESDNLIAASATIDTVDRENRIVTLHDDETGDAFKVYANDGIRNLEQLDPGDKVLVEYYESTAVAMADPQDLGETTESVVVGTADEGEKPAALVVESKSMLVEIVEYTEATGLATFITSDGSTQSTTVAPELRSFAESLNPGDRVRVSLTEAAAVTIQEVGS